MSFRPDSPVELPDGRLTCGPHGLVVCSMCCVDYSFMDEVLGGSEDDDDSDIDFINQGVHLSELSSDKGTMISDHTGSVPDTDWMFNLRVRDWQKLRVGTGNVIPEKFAPSNYGDTPQQLFTCRVKHQFPRFINQRDSTQMLIYTDGACLNNGQANSRAGWGVVFSDSNTVSGRLESKGPTGEEHKETSNRAELRAVIAALRFRWWPGWHEFKSLVIATDSEYVVEGITGWVQGWLQNGWKTRNGLDVKNKDLWQVLLGEVQRYADSNFTVKFWRIPREYNIKADDLAKEAANHESCNKYVDIEGFLV